MNPNARPLTSRSAEPLCSVSAVHLCQLQRQHMFLTTEAYNEMPTLRGEGYLNANAFYV